jgi:hypothetical protein
MISEYTDGLLKGRRAEALEKHVETCASCREVLKDFRLISRTAARLESPEPSEEVWIRIKSGLAEPQALKESRSRVRGFEWGAPRLRYAGAALIVLAFVTAGVFIGIRLGQQNGGMSFSESAKYTLAKLDEAERYYEMAIESLNEAMAAQKGLLGPEVAEMFERNLMVIDASIQACRQAVIEAPDDIEARKFLLAAYMDKVSYLNTVLDFPEETPAGGDSGIIL